jgi:hypothetical protein
VSLAAEVTFVVVAGLGAAVCLATLAVHLPAGQRLFESALRPPVRGDLDPAQLVRIERIVAWSGSSALDAHTRLRPLLTEIAAGRLARSGVRWERDVAEARRLLGPTAWELLRPDRPPPGDRLAPGIGPRQLEEILDALEAL